MFIEYILCKCTEKSIFDGFSFGTSRVRDSTYFRSSLFSSKEIKKKDIGLFSSEETNIPFKKHLFEMCN